MSKNLKNDKILKRLEQEYHLQNIIERAKNEKALILKQRIYLNQNLEFTWPSLKEKAINESGKCYGLRHQIAILVDGNVVPCCLDQDGDITLGNIFNESLEKILSKKICKNMVQGFENRKLTQPLCKTCGFIKRFNINK